MKLDSLKNGGRMLRWSFRNCWKKDIYYITGENEDDEEKKRREEQKATFEELCKVSVVFTFPSAIGTCVKKMLDASLQSVYKKCINKISRI